MFHVEAVVTVVDAETGAQTLAWSAEARKQAILADRLVITKTDIAGEGAADGWPRNCARSIRAPKFSQAVNGELDPEPADRAGTRPAQRLRRRSRAQRRHRQFRAHAKTQPMPWPVFARAMDTLMAHARRRPAAREGLPRRRRLQGPGGGAIRPAPRPSAGRTGQPGPTATARAAWCSSPRIFRKRRCAICSRRCAAFA